MYSFTDTVKKKKKDQLDTLQSHKPELFPAAVVLWGGCHEPQETKECFPLSLCKGHNGQLLVAWFPHWETLTFSVLLSQHEKCTESILSCTKRRNYFPTSFSGAWGKCLALQVYCCRHCCACCAREVCYRTNYCCLLEWLSTLWKVTGWHLSICFQEKLLKTF